MTGSCIHVQCQLNANVAAGVSMHGDDEGRAYQFVDLARVEPGLRSWSVDCSAGDAIAYMRDAESGRWAMFRVSQVTDPDLVRRLEEARAAQGKHG